MKKLLLVLSLVVAGVLRFYNNIAVSLWHDEAFSALYISKYGWGEMMHRIILDVHPPLYYWVLRIWSYVFGHGILSLRSLSILLGIMTVWMGYLLVKKAFKNENWALVAAMLLAINPFQIQYALEARMYTLGTFLVLLSSYLLIKALEDKKALSWIFYGIAVAACAYTHYFLLFSLLAQGLYWLYYCFKNYKLSFLKQRDFLWGVSAYVLSAVLYIPWIPSFIEQNTRVNSGYWIQAPDRWAVPGTIWKIMFGGEGINRRVLMLATVISIILAIYFVRKIKSQTKWLIFLGLVIPFVGAVALSVKTSIYLDRYFVFASLFMSIVVGLSLLQIPKSTVKNTLIGILMIVSVVAFFKNWQKLDVKDLFTNRAVNKKPGMAKAAELVNETALPNDKVFVASSFIFFTYQYYNHTPIKPLLLSDRPVEEIPHFAGTAILANDELQITKDGLVPQEVLLNNSTVWVVWTTGFGGSKPNVPGNWSQVQEKEFPDTPGFKGSIFVSQYHVR